MSDTADAVLAIGLVVSSAATPLAVYGAFPDAVPVQVALAVSWLIGFATGMMFTGDAE